MTGKTLHARLIVILISGSGRGPGPVAVNLALNRRPLVPVPAKSDEGRRRVVELLLARTCPELTPFRFEPVDVIAGRGGAPFLESLLGQGRQRSRVGRQGGMLAP